MILKQVAPRLQELLGREVVRVVDGFESAGLHEVTIGGSGLVSGVYLLRVGAGGTRQTRSVVVLR